MELNAIRELVEKTKGVEGYIVLDSNGSVLTQDLGAYANRMKRTEFATWILNCFHAIDSFYPQALCLLMQYASGRLYLTRTDNKFITVMCRHGADIHSLENAFSKHRQFMTKSNSSGVAPKKSKKGETVFLKISETGPGATKSPIPQKQSNSPTGIIIGSLVVIAAIIGVVAFITSGSPADEEPAAPEPVANSAPAAPQSATPSGATVSQADVTMAEERATALANIARAKDASSLAPMEMARALANSQSAADASKAGDLSASVDQWRAAAESYGFAAVTSAEKQFYAAIESANLEIAVDFPTPLWIGIENAIKQAKASAEAGNFTAAVQSITSQEGKLPELREMTLTKLGGLAQTAATNNNIPGAIDFYTKVLAIDPENAAAREFIYQNRFDPGETMTNSIGMALAYVPPGTFVRGSPETEAFRDADEVPAQVTITAGYFIAATEVTQQQWRQVMGQAMRTEDAEPGLIGDQLPVHSISWQQAAEFCQRLSERDGNTYRLPTEAEWEYAARAGTQSPYNTGSQRLTSRNANVYDPSGEGLETIAAVGSVGNPNAWGLYDMHGNVWEWTADWSAPYQPGPQIDPTGPATSDGRIDLAMKVVRGGSFIDDAYIARSANRSEASPVVANTYTGFRPVMELADL